MRKSMFAEVIRRYHVISLSSSTIQKQTGSFSNNNLRSHVKFSFSNEFLIAFHRWEYAAPMNVARYSFVLVALAGKLWALGGINDKGKLSSIEAYDPVKNFWSLIPSEEKNLGDVFGGVLFN